MNALKNDLLLRALRGETVSRPPVWMMRQAGRYLPEFRKLREQYSFFTRCETPELAARITMMPVEQIGVDAAILFSDILVVPRAMGLEVQLVDGRGPVLPEPLRSREDLERIEVPDVAERLQFVFEAIRLTCSELGGRVPLIGFAGSPWTILCYMVEGTGSKTFDQAKGFCFRNPEAAGELLGMITETTISYLKGQAEAGADCLQVFDSWGGLLGPEDFKRLSLPYLKQIVTELQGICPVILFSKGSWYALEELGSTGAQGIGLDWCIGPGEARNWAGSEVCLQGNLDPAHLLAPVQEIVHLTRNMVRGFGKDRYIANLGHGILPETPVSHARAFVDTVKDMTW
ncbi:MAG TPA: uroporphyrinogen decarboxylase [Chitinophagaceae bacterium]|nr:uroporphyrinogen decarboxylase [Chitinophagaceae bacterium]